MTKSMTVESHDEIEVSVVMPCLDEAETLGRCVDKAWAALAVHGITGEVVVADNGSVDGSPQVARGRGARVVHVAAKGYGSALAGGIDAARGRYVIICDADASYDIEGLYPFVRELRQGAELVMGNRFSGGIHEGAMPFLHRYLGNPVLSFLGRLFFKSPVRDFHCGMRGFSKEAINGLRLHTSGMEFASEMVVKATIQGLAIREVPTRLFPDGRSRAPHLRRWRDGWRHLTFMLLFSPRWLFLYPGLFLMAMGAMLGLWLFQGPRHIGGVTLDIHSLLYAAGFFITGFQVLVFALFTKLYAVSEGLHPSGGAMTRIMGSLSLGKGVGAGMVMALLGVMGSAYAVLLWRGTGFGDLDASRMLRWVIPSVTFVVCGVQTVFSSFFLSILQLKQGAFKTADKEGLG